mgnify:FL=1
MQIVLSPELEINLKRLTKNDKSLKAKITKQLNLFKQNQRYSSLRTHKLTGELKNLWSISITRKIRMVYILEGDIAIFTKLGTHDEVYSN